MSSRKHGRKYCASYSSDGPSAVSPKPGAAQPEYGLYGINEGNARKEFAVALGILDYTNPDRTPRVKVLRTGAQFRSVGDQRVNVFLRGDHVGTIHAESRIQFGGTGDCLKEEAFTDTSPGQKRTLLPQDEPVVCLMSEDGRNIEKWASLADIGWAYRRRFQHKEFSDPQARRGSSRPTTALGRPFVGGRHFFRRTA